MIVRTITRQFWGQGGTKPQWLCDGLGCCSFDNMTLQGLPVAQWAGDHAHQMDGFSAP